MALADYPNRPIEFRAYYPPTNALFEVVIFGPRYLFAKDTLIPYSVEQCVLMQFTGLYDSQGRKVFEGDILYSYYEAHSRNPSSEYWRVVAFREGCFIELQRIDEETTWRNLEPLLNTEQDRIVDCYYLRPDLLELNTQYGYVPTSFD